MERERDPWVIWELSALRDPKERRIMLHKQLIAMGDDPPTSGYETLPELFGMRDRKLREHREESR